MKKSVVPCGIIMSIICMLLLFALSENEGLSIVGAYLFGILVISIIVKIRMS